LQLQYGYNVIRQRIYGSEAKVMLNQIINAQIAYYLSIINIIKRSILSVYNDGDEPEGARKMIYENLHIEIPKGQLVEYDF
jgi:hypothetical protein